MRILNILQERFIWASNMDEQNARQLSSLVKYNNGVFKSFKQAQFLLSNRGPFDWRDDAENMRKYFNIELKPGERATGVDGTAQWSEHGGRGNRPVTWFYVFDEYGVVRKYKLGYVGDMRSGTHPDPSKTKLEWSRPTNVDISHLKQQQQEIKQRAAESKSTHVGQPKDRLTFDATIKKVVDRGMNDYGDYVYMNILEDENGNLFFYTGGKELGDEGKKITITATVKKHITTKMGEPATVINRPRVK